MLRLDLSETLSNKVDPSMSDEVLASQHVSLGVRDNSGVDRSNPDLGFGMANWQGSGL